MKGPTLEMVGEGAYAYLQPGGWGLQQRGFDHQRRGVASR